MTVVTIKQAGPVTVMDSGDWHVGSAETDYKALEKSVDVAVEEDMDVALMGDILDTPTRTSLTSPWQQAMSPREAYRYADNLIKKLQEKRRRVRCGVLGNHPWRIEKDSGLNPEEALYENNGVVNCASLAFCIISCLTTTAAPSSIFTTRRVVADERARESTLPKI